MSTIGENILQRRKRLGWTQNELAKRMGYKSKSTINKIESGINNISQNKVEQFATVLGTTPAELMGWNATPKKPQNNITDNEKELLNLYRQVSADNRELIIELLRLIAKNKDEKPTI